MKLSKIIHHGLRSAFVATIGIAGASAFAATAVTIAQSSQSLNFVPMYVAQAAGYFKDEGLEVTTILAGGGPKAMTGMLGGSANFAAATLADGIAANRRGFSDVKALATFLNGYASGIMLRQDVATRLGITPQTPLKQRAAALKGLKIGMTTAGSFSDALVRNALLLGGLKPDSDAEIIPLGGADAMTAALRSGKVDACACVPPVDLMMFKDKTGMPLITPSSDMAGSNNVALAILFTTASYAKAQPATVQSFVRAIARAEQLIAKDPEAAKKYTRTAFAQMDAATYDIVWEAFLPFVAKSPVIAPESVAKEVEMQMPVTPPENRKPVSPDALIDASFARKAVEGLPK